MKTVKIIGAGLAGCEAAYQLAKRNIKVELYECKRSKKSPAHKSDFFCELVCSNSLKSNEISSAGGLIKQELRLLDSLVIRMADKTRVPAGGALAVDRDEFAKQVTNEILKNKNITIKEEYVTDFNEKEPTIIATGPLTIGELNDNIINKLGENLHFYDASSPIVSFESLDLNKMVIKSRYDKGGDDYINAFMDKDEFIAFYNELILAESVILKEFEKSDIFEGCMPIEIMAKRGADTIRFGPLKPVGFYDEKKQKRPFAVVQLRKENANGDMYNLVGFQTNLKFNEQKRVFSLIPGLEKAEFLRYGVMHRNSFINAPKILNSGFQLLKYPNVFIAGQLSGVEGYCESIASGLIASINMFNYLNNKDILCLPKTTIIGALSMYLSLDNENFQPMNANFGILPPLEEKIKDKKLKKTLMAERSLNDLDKYLTKLN